MTLRNFAAVLFCIFSFTVVAQNVNDAGMWNSLSFSSQLKDILPRKTLGLAEDLTLSFNPEMRFDENISQLNGYFSDFGIAKKWSKYLSTSVEYRLGTKKEETWYNLRRRWSLGAQWSIPIKNFKFSFTSRYQISQVNTNDVDLKSTWRQKATVEYSFSKNITGQVSHEMFFLPITLENSDWRSQFILKYKLNKSRSISLGYLIQKDLSNADMDFVFLTGYKLEFNKKKKKSTPPLP